MKKILITILDKLPYINGLRRDINTYEKWGLPGHFYNPIPSVEEVKIFEKNNAFTDNNVELNLNEAEQVDLLQKFLPFYKEMSISENEVKGSLYFFNNPNYSYSDAIFYYSILLNYKPKKVIEVGSGFSSCLLLDTNKVYFNSDINITFIEPYPELLKSLAKNHPIQLIEKRIQEVDPKLFLSLEDNDILFIDSSHVIKAGSDLNFIFFQILPRLKPGVLIHFHDIFDRFLYPEKWITEEHRAWNELYGLRLFLMHNDSYKIVAFNNFIIRKHEAWFEENMPLCLKNKGGSIWLKKIK